MSIINAGLFLKSCKCDFNNKYTYLEKIFQMLRLSFEILSFETKSWNVFPKERNNKNTKLSSKYKHIRPDWLLKEALYLIDC